VISTFAVAEQATRIAAAVALFVHASAVTPLEGIGAASLDDDAARQHHLPMPAVYTTPPHLRPVTLWRLPLADGRAASATLAPTTTYCGIVWYLDEDLQDAAQFSEREAALAWAEDVRRMLRAPVRS
jgi:hypothetical protein